MKLSFYALNSNKYSIDELLSFIEIIKSHQSIDSKLKLTNRLFNENEWNDLRIKIILVILCVTWSRNTSTYAFYGSYFNSTRNLSDNNNPKIMNHLKYCLQFTIQLLLLPSIEAIITDVLTKLIELMIHQLPKSVAIVRYDSKLFIQSIETIFTSIILRYCNLAFQIEYYKAIIHKKIEIRDYIPGYSIAVNELLKQYPHLKYDLYELFTVIIIHSTAITKIDQEWTNNIVKQYDSNMNYDNYSLEILNHTAIRTEKKLLNILSQSNNLNNNNKEMRKNNFDKNDD